MFSKQLHTFKVNGCLHGSYKQALPSRTPSKHDLADRLCQSSIKFCKLRSGRFPRHVVCALPVKNSLNSTNASRQNRLSFLSTAVIKAIGPQIQNFSPPLLLFLAQVCVRLRCPPEASELESLCKAWQIQLSQTSYKQNVVFLSCLADLYTIQEGSTWTAAADAGFVSADWLRDVYNHVAYIASDLTLGDISSLMAAAAKLGDLLPVQTSKLLATLPSTSATYPAQEAAETLVLLGKMGYNPPGPLLPDLMRSMHAGEDQLSPDLLFAAIQAGCALSYDLDLSWMTSACKLAQPKLSSCNPQQLLIIMSATADIISIMPSLLMQFKWQNSNNTGARSNNANTKSAIAFDAIRDLMAEVSVQLQPALSTFSVRQLMKLAQCMQKCKYMELVNGPQVAYGFGQGARGQGVVNSFPVTVIQPPSDDVPGSAGTTIPAVQNTSSTSVPPEVLAAVQQQFKGSTVVVMSAAEAASQLSVTAGLSNTVVKPSVGGTFTQAVHAAYLDRINEFETSDQLADMVRSLSSAFPDQTLLSQLALRIVTSSSDQPAASGGSSSEALTDHGLCLALFLFSILSRSPGQAALLAAQRRLTPAFKDLDVSDLTSAIWAFAVLDTSSSKSTDAAQSASTQRENSSTNSTSAPAASTTSSTDSTGAFTSTRRMRTLADIAASNTANARARAADTSIPAQGPYAGLTPDDLKPENGTANTSTLASLVSSGTATSSLDSETPQSEGWLDAAVSCVCSLVMSDALAPYQLAFVLGSFERAGAKLNNNMMDLVLDSFQRQLSSAGSGDMVLMLATVARLGHIAKYTWVEEVVERWAAERLTTFTPKQLSTITWALVKLHHRPSRTFYTDVVDAAEAQLPSFTADNLATLLWALAELDTDAPVTLFLDSVCKATETRLTEFTPRDLISLLTTMARFQYQPSAEWVSDWLRCVSSHMSFLTPQDAVQVVAALAGLNCRISNSKWWGRMTNRMTELMPGMDGELLLKAAGSLVELEVAPPQSWSQKFSETAERLCQPPSSNSSWPTSGGNDRSLQTPTTSGVTASSSQSTASTGVHLATAFSMSQSTSSGSGVMTEPSAGSSTWAAAAQSYQPFDASQHEQLLAYQVKLDIAPGPKQMRALELKLAGLTAMKSLGPVNLVRLVTSLASVADRWGASAPMPRSGWVGGPFCESLRAALPDLAVLQQSQLAKSLGQLVSALDKRHAAFTVAKVAGLSSGGTSAWSTSFGTQQSNQSMQESSASSNTSPSLSQQQQNTASNGSSQLQGKESMQDASARMEGELRQKKSSQDAGVNASTSDSNTGDTQIMLVTDDGVVDVTSLASGQEDASSCGLSSAGINSSRQGQSMPESNAGTVGSNISDQKQRDVWSEPELLVEQPQRAPDALRNLSAYLREFYLYG